MTSSVVELDCRGLLCPLPVLRTKRALGTLAAGEILKLVATDPASVPDMAAFGRSTGNEIVRWSESGGEFVFFVRKA